MNNLPNIIVVSCSNTKPKSIIKLITQKNPEEDSSGVIVQPWNIDTKYYSATVNLVGLHKAQRYDEFSDKAEALIIHVDTNKSSGLDDLKQWELLESECSPEVKLLISNYCNDDTKITRSVAIAWCLKRGFEFIELYPSDLQSSEDDIITEKFGVNRVIEALQAHTWSNLEMKNKKIITKNSETLSLKQAPNLHFPNEFPDELSGEDDFTELFSQLHMMKDSLQSLPMNQRKQCAEEMVTAFWKAIGGDEEELLDL